MVIIQANTVRLLAGDGIRFLSSPKLHLQIGNCLAFKGPPILQASLNIVDSVGEMLVETQKGSMGDNRAGKAASVPLPIFLVVLCLDSPSSIRKVRVFDAARMYVLGLVLNPRLGLVVNHHVIPDQFLGLFRNLSVGLSGSSIY